MSQLISLESDADVNAALLSAGTKPVIADFYATWCGPCQMIAPFYKDLAARFPQLCFIKIDIDKCPEAKMRYGVNAMPTFCALLNGQKMDEMKGADKGALEKFVTKWSKNVPTQHESPVVGQIALNHMISTQGLECLNEDDTHNLRNFLEGLGTLHSDCDEQLILNIPFSQPVKIHSIEISGPAGKGPKAVKIFANNPTTLDFDSAMGAEAIQVLDFSEKEVQPLRFVKFQNVQNIQLFIENNKEGSDKTIVEQLKFYGQPLQASTNMDEFKRPGGINGYRKMNVERLMKDLTVEQLQDIYSSLIKEVENKKEELRQMVGRRYRDVILAANAVKRLTEVSADIVTELQTLKPAVKEIAADAAEKRTGAVVAKRLCAQRFALLSGVLPLIGTTSDALSDVFALLVAEALHRGASIDVAATLPHAARLLQLYGEQLVGHRLRLRDRIASDVGECTEWSVVAGQLVALRLLQPQLTIAQLLDAFLEARAQYVAAGLRSSTLIGLIRMIKETVGCVDKVFGAGRALESAMQCVATPGWCPDPLLRHVEDQLFLYSRLFTVEFEKINKLCSASADQWLSRADVTAKCDEWLQTVATDAAPSVTHLCALFERTEQFVEFGAAVGELFKSDAASTPTVPPLLDNGDLYRRMFGDALIVRFAQLMADELKTVEAELRAAARKVNCNPPPLFQKRVAKFDGLLASGVSAELHAVVQKFFDRLRDLQHRVLKYAQIGFEADTAVLSAHLADAVLEVVRCLTAEHERPAKSADTAALPQLLPSEENQNWLREFRLHLALVQYEPSILSQCMGDETAKAVEANRLLREAAENALCHLMTFIIEESVQDAELHQIPLACADPAKCLDYVQMNARIVLDKTRAISIDVPTQLSPKLFDFLYRVCRRISQNSFGHLFSRAVSTHVAVKLGSILATCLHECAQHVPKRSPFCAQLLLDAHILAQMFPMVEQFGDTVDAIRQKMDPVDFQLMDGPLYRHAETAAQRSVNLFGQLQVDAVMSADGAATQSTATYGDAETPLIDVMPRLENVPRLGAIPRLSKIKERQKEHRGRTGAAANAAAAKRQDAKNLNFTVEGLFGFFSGKAN